MRDGATFRQPRLKTGVSRLVAVPELLLRSVVCETNHFHRLRQEL